MKQKILYSLIACTILLSAFQFCFASTITRERPSDDLGITKNIEVTSQRKSIIENTPYVDASEKVYDYADLFTSSEEKDLYDNIQNFIEEANMDMAIVTIDDNNKSSSEAYADDFYDYNDFGIGNEYDGILFLIDMDNRNMWISTTGKAIDLFQSDVESILDSCYTYISSEDYYNCGLTFINSTNDSYKGSIAAGWIIGFGLAIIISLIIPTVFCLVKKSKHKAIKLADDADSYLDKSSISITNSQDIFVRTHTTKIAKPTDTGGSGGSHSGSSGISHGGGGRSF